MAVTKCTPPTPWGINDYPPFADHRYKSGTKPAKEMGPRLDRFDDYTTATDIPDPAGGQALWSHVENGDNARVRKDVADVAIEPSWLPSGGNCLTVTATEDVTENVGVNATPEYVPIPAQPYLQFFTPDGGRWRYIHEVVRDDYQETWDYNTYNRMSFYIKTPPDLNVPTDGTANLSIGTYYASIVDGPPTSSDAEVGGGNHGYHRGVIAAGCTTKAIVDFNPTHIRQAPGGEEQEYQEYPIAADKPKYNYWDCTTRFYFATANADNGSKWWFDEFQFYRENRPEESHEVYTLTLSHNPSGNVVSFSFNGRKDRTVGQQYEVVYSFESIHGIGFDNANEWGLVVGANSTDYNAIFTQRSDIDLTGQDRIYVAVRKLGDVLFKQIDIELNLDAGA